MFREFLDGLRLERDGGRLVSFLAIPGGQLPPCRSMFRGQGLVGHRSLVDLRQGIMGLFEVRILAESRLEGGDGGFEVAHALVRSAKVVVGEGELVLQVDGFFGRLQCLGMSTHLHIATAQPHQALGIGLVDGDPLQQARLRLFQSVERDEDVPAVGMELAGSLVGFSCPVQEFERSFEVAVAGRCGRCEEVQRTRISLGHPAEFSKQGLFALREEDGFAVAVDSRQLDGFGVGVFVVVLLEIVPELLAIFGRLVELGDATSGQLGVLLHPVRQVAEQ